MAESSKKTEKYIPNPFEAAALKELHQLLLNQQLLA